MKEGLTLWDVLTHKAWGGPTEVKVNFVERRFGQATTSTMSGVSQEVLRDWRRRDFLNGIGEQGENSRWRYSFDEILLLAIARVLDGCGQPVRQLIYMADRLRFFVLAHYRPDEEIFAAFADKDGKFPLDQNGHVSARFSPLAPPDSVEEIFAEHPLAILVNTRRLVESLPEDINLMLREEA